jgi:carbamoyl-phosphate synthase large subunit
MGALPRARRAVDRDDYELTKIDPWFPQQFAEIVALRDMAALGEFRDSSILRTLKRTGFSDGTSPASTVGEEVVRQRRLTRARARLQTHRHVRRGVRVVHAYGTHEDVCEADPTPRKKVIILGKAEPHGQASSSTTAAVTPCSVKEEGFETVMVNCNRRRS